MKVFVLSSYDMDCRQEGRRECCAHTYFVFCIVFEAFGLRPSLRTGFAPLLLKKHSTRQTSYALSFNQTEILYSFANSLNCRRANKHFFILSTIDPHCIIQFSVQYKLPCCQQRYTVISGLALYNLNLTCKVDIYLYNLLNESASSSSRYFIFFKV